MVQFGSGYFQPMDREYGHHHHAHEAAVAPAQGATNDVGVDIGDFGMSLGLGPVPNVQAIKSKLYAGTKKMEFVFTGAGKGSGQGQTPEMYGLKQRQALTEISAANRVDFTTHATVGVYGLAGMDQQGNFSKQSKNFSLQEIKRAIEFAADVSRGGPVVVHTGEFQRPLIDADWNREGEWAGRFKMYEDEEERFTYRVVDSRTGGVIQEARRNRRVARPVWNVAEQGGEYTDFDGQRKVASGSMDDIGRPIYLDYFGKRLEPENRVPKYDNEKGTFMVHQLDWDDLKEEARIMTDRAKEVWRDWKQGKMSDAEYRESYWFRFKDALSEGEIQVRPEEAFIISTLETNAANSRGWAYYYGAGFQESVEDLKKLRKAYDFYKQLEEATDPEEQWKLKQQIGSFHLPRDLVPPDSKFPSEILRQRIIEMEGKMKQGQEASASQWAQAEESMETIRYVESAETYAFKEACDAYAQAAMAAMMHTDKLKQEGKLKKELFIAMENLFPESYGAHPDELMRLVEGSRSRMAQMLVQQKGMAEAEARQRAEAHINTTLDTGHFNMWRKYWQADPHKSMRENDEEYNRWMLQKLGEMTKRKMIGHVHIDDNYGYHDDHLAPGEGNTPIKEMIKTLKENGYKGELIVEPGADYTTDLGGFQSVMKTWRMFGSPVYGAGSGVSPQRRSWSQVGYGWFGQNAPPYFTFGGYSPSEDWTLWSGVPLE